MLVMALWVTGALATLALLFVVMILDDSRGSRQSAWQVMSAEGAEWGVETCLSYMGRGGNWQAAFDEERLIFFDLLNADQPNGQEHLSAASGQQSSIHVQVEAGDGADSALRTLRLVDPSLPQGAVLQIDSDMLAKVAVEVRPVTTPLASYGPGQAPQYLLSSRCELFRRIDLQQGGEWTPVAVSQLEAQVRPEVETTALFHVQNLRSWDVPGGGIGNPNLADKIIIPSVYKSAGSVKVTGTDPNESGSAWSAQAGNLRFQDPTSSEMVFQGQLSVNQLNNLDLAGNSVSGANAENFPGGVVFGADFLPFPSTERFLSEDSNGDGQLDMSTSAGLSGELGLLASAALETDAPETPHGESVSGYYRVGKELVVEAHQRNPRLPSQTSTIPLAQQDYRPPIPEVEVRLKEGGFIEVNFWETTAGDGGFTSQAGNLNSVASLELGSAGGPLGQSFHVDQLKNGLLYIEGGQVVVHSELESGEAAEFEGRLQIVAAEDAVRRGQVKRGNGTQTYANSAQSLYHPAVKQYMDWQVSRMALPSDDPNHLPAAQFQSPPYTAGQLRQASQAGGVSVSLSDLASVSDSSPYWMNPSAAAEPEGNLVVAGDILKKEGTNSLIGLTAENYLLLNDRTIGQKAKPNELEVQGVLTSFEHSLQFDWTNLSNNRVPGAYAQSTSTGFDGKIVLQGSMLAPFSDVEGDGRGRGYPRQEFRHDSELARWSPPFQPRTLLSEYPNDQIAIAWSVIGFKDRTSRGVRLP